MRILLDTNILVSALLSRDGPPGQVLAAVKQHGHTLITSVFQIEELQSVVRRKHLRSRISREDAEDLVYNLEAVGVVVAELPEIDLSPDPDDNFILAAAVAGKADMLVSGDKADMLSLGKVEGIPILTAREALERLRQQEQ